LLLLLACSPRTGDTAEVLAETGPVAWTSFETDVEVVEFTDPEGAEGPALYDSGRFERCIVYLRESSLGDFVGIELIKPRQGEDCTLGGPCGFRVADALLTTATGEVLLDGEDEALDGFVHVERLHVEGGVIDFRFDIDIGEGRLTGEVFEGRFR